MGVAVRDPYLWSAFAALFFGLALGQASRWVATLGSAGADWRRVRASRSARAITLASLGILAGAAFLVFPPKTSLAQAGLVTWAISCLVAGALAGFWPRAAGLPLAALLATSFVALHLGLSGWIVFRGPGPVATLLPLEVNRPSNGSGRGDEAAATSFRGELETVERDSVPVVQKLSMAGAEASLAVESIELSGPLGLATSIVRSGATGRFYRLAALVGSTPPPLAFPPPARLLGALAAMGPDEGFAPGEPFREHRALFGFFVRRRSASERVPLLALEPVRFGLGENMEVLVESSR
jgi:hypothetical protein